MQIQNIQNKTNFNGRAYMISECGKLFYKNAARQINSMKAMRNANFNLYIGEAAYFPNKFCMVAAEKEQDIYNYPHQNTTARLASRNIPSIISTAKELIAEHGTKLEMQNKKSQSIFQKIVNFIMDK